MYELEIARYVPHQAYQIVRKTCRILNKICPPKLPFKVVMLAAYDIPDFQGGYAQGFFMAADPCLPTSVIYICCLVHGSYETRKTFLQDSVCHEWGHRVQLEEGLPICENENKPRTKKLLNEVRRLWNVRGNQRKGS